MQNQNIPVQYQDMYMQKNRKTKRIIIIISCISLALVISLCTFVFIFFRETYEFVPMYDVKISALSARGGTEGTHVPLDSIVVNYKILDKDIGTDKDLYTVVSDHDAEKYDMTNLKVGETYKYGFIRVRRRIGVFEALFGSLVNSIDVHTEHTEEEKNMMPFSEQIVREVYIFKEI